MVAQRNLWLSVSTALLFFPGSFFASPLPRPTALVLPRNHAGPSLNQSDITVQDPRTATTAQLGAQQVGATTTSSSASATATIDQGQTYFSGLPSQLLEWVAVVIVSGVLISMLVARFLFIRRYYPPTFRAYFIPTKGIHISFLRIHIRGPPARPSRSHLSAGARGAGRTRRSRRDRTTTGPGIGEGGRRAGDRDEDDLEEEDQRQHDVRGELPAYGVDPDLPSYDFVDAVTGQAALSRVGALDAPTTTNNGSASEEETVVMPTVQEYEEATRRARAAALPVLRPQRARIVDGDLRRNSSAGESSTSTYLSGVDEGEGSSVKDGKGKNVAVAGGEDIELGEMRKEEEDAGHEEDGDRRRETK